MDMFEALSQEKWQPGTILSHALRRVRYSVRFLSWVFENKMDMVARVRRSDCTMKQSNNDALMDGSMERIG